MAERVSGPYRGYYISAAARLTHPGQPAGQAEAPIYVGSVSLAQHGRTMRIASRRSSISASRASALPPRTKRSRKSSRLRATISTGCCSP